jgi:hypothetical protein
MAATFYVQSDVVALSRCGWKDGNAFPAATVKDKKASPHPCFEVAILKAQAAAAGSGLEESCISWTLRTSRGKVKEHGVTAVSGDVAVVSFSDACLSSLETGDVFVLEDVVGGSGTVSPFRSTQLQMCEGPGDPNFLVELFLRSIVTIRYTFFAAM